MRNTAGEESEKIIHNGNRIVCSIIWHLNIYMPSCFAEGYG